MKSANIQSDKIPYQQAFQESGINEENFLARLDDFGLSGFTCLEEGIDPEILNQIISSQNSALPQGNPVSQENPSHAEDEVEEPDETTLITANVAIEILQEQSGITVSQSKIAEITEVLGYEKDEKFPRSEMPNVVELVCWEYASQLQQTVTSQSRGLATETREALKEEATMTGAMDAFVEEVSYSQGYLDTRKTLKRERSKALKSSRIDAALDLDEAVKLGKKDLSTQMDDWLNSSKQQLSQAQSIQSAREKFLKKRSR